MVRRAQELLDRVGTTKEEMEDYLRTVAPGLGSNIEIGRTAPNMDMFPDIDHVKVYYLTLKCTVFKIQSGSVIPGSELPIEKVNHKLLGYAVKAVGIHLDRYQLLLPFD